MWNHSNCSGSLLFCFRDIFLGHGGSWTRIISVSLDGSCRVYEFASGKLLLSLIVDAVTLTSVTADVLESSLFLGCGTGDILTVSLRESPRQIVHHLSEKEKQSVFRGKKAFWYSYPYFVGD